VTTLPSHVPIVARSLSLVAVASIVASAHAQGAVDQPATVTSRVLRTEASRDWNREAPNKALQRPGALAGLRNERLEESMSRSLTRRIAWTALAPAAEGQGR